ncbi:MAG: glycoside hydrolase family protein [Pseudomonadota bacterium]|nr:glycoside hydrolase family protein [Pseudomonadota bacterium]
MTRSINRAGLDLVKHFEGFYPQAYRCPAGILTIGYGHTGSDVTDGLRISPARAESLLKDDLASACVAVRERVQVPLTDNQFAALVSFTFNCGAANLASSTLLAKLNLGDYAAVPGELNRWVKATDPATGRKRSLPGLVRRREAEGDLWLTPDCTLPAAQRAIPQQIEPPDEESRYRVVARSGLRLRGGPDLTFDTIEILATGQEITARQRRGEWVEVDKNDDGLVDGWVFAAYLEPVA